jgi:glucan biosynthesis protein
LGFGLVRRGLAFHFADSAFEHLGVELEADGLDVSALLAAEEITGAAQFEIECGDLESGA